MSKRMIGSVIFAFVLGALFFAGTVLLSGTVAQSYATSQGAVKAAPQPKAAVAGIWEDIAPFPTVSIAPTPGSYPLKLKRAGAAAYPPNGKVYVMGGRHGTDGEDVTLQWIWEYTPGDPGTWLRKNALLDGSQPGSRYTANMAVAVLTDTNGPRVYAVGGSSINSEPTPSVRIYDPNADTIDTSSADPWPANPPRIPGGYAVYNNKLYIFGGFSSIGSGAVFTDTWVFDPMASHGTQWSQITSANLGLGRGYIAGAELDGYIYAIGGDKWDVASHTLLPVNNVERMDPRAASPSWTVLAALPTARGDMGAWAYDSGTGYEISGRIAVAGGVYPTPDATGYLYNPSTNSWGAFPSLVHATRDYGAAQLNGYLYAMGGYDYSSGIPAGANFNQRYDATQPIGTPTNTATGTPPTATSTQSPTNTVTPTSTPCSNSYASATATATLVPGTTDQSINCDDCTGTVSIPFSFAFYDRAFSSVNISSNGNLQFNSEDSEYSNSCLPAANFDYAILPYWDDLVTDSSGNGCSAYPTGCGVFTSLSGSAPSRIFNIEWRAALYSGVGAVNFEVRLYEGQSRFDIVYGSLAEPGTSATVGIQKDTGSVYYQFECETGGLAQNLAIQFTSTNCVPPTATATVATTNTPTVTATRTSTDTPVPPTLTATGTPTTEPTSTGTPCAISFSDVHPGDYFYEPVRYLYCLGAVSGYSDGTFRPYANTTRSQLTKILVAAEGWTIDTTGGPHFADVPTSDPFYSWVETAYHHGDISGYADHTFRPFNDVTRGQLSKIAVLAQSWTIDTSGGPHFSDVPTTNPFYNWIETAYHHSVISGYADGSFKPANGATRGQISKIVYNALTNP